jgi:hypothetical protein
VFELAEWFQGFDLEKTFVTPPYHRRIIAVLRKVAEPPPPAVRPRPETTEEPPRSSRGARRPRRRSSGPARPTQARPTEREEPASGDAGGRSSRRRSRTKQPAQPRPEAAEREREDYPPADAGRPRVAPGPSVRLPAGRSDGEPIVEYWARGREDKWQPPRASRPPADEPPVAGDLTPAPTAKTRRPRRRRKKTEGGAPPDESPGGQGG